ncbi:MAG TPA: hypothetical protein VH092_05315 [Urbifossiella sp.]|jgi:hypothetical protein|nr:hypothetical protein [Urbifossiella sp.]
MAMEYGQAYRLAISTDGTRIRLAPDTLDFSSAPVVNAPGSAVTALETRLDKATAGLIADDDTSAPGGDGNWVTIGTFLPDGTCRETGSLIQIHEGNFPPIQIQLRGMSASARVLPLNATVNNTNGASSANSANGAKQGGG